MEALTHTTITIRQIERLHAYTQCHKPVVIDGQSLDIAAVTAVSKSVPWF
jgi:hypothetical protein